MFATLTVPVSASSSEYSLLGIFTDVFQPGDHYSGE